MPEVISSVYHVKAVLNAFSDPHFPPSGNILIILDDVPYVACIIFTTSLPHHKLLYNHLLHFICEEAG